MHFHDKTIEFTARNLSTDLSFGLNRVALEKSVSKNGYNSLTKTKGKNFFLRLLDALSEPTLIILAFSLVIALGSNIGLAISGESADYSECIGILFAIVLSVSITLIMEGSSKKAFEALNRIYEDVSVTVIRQGEMIKINQKFVAVGDILLIESGDKIVADGRLIESNFLTINESVLTGESVDCEKDANLILKQNLPLAERKNCVYSGTLVVNGSGKMIVTAVGDDTEIGKIAKEISKNKENQTPLQYKLSRLSKAIAIIGVICAFLIFGVNAFKLVIEKKFNFSSVRELFISCIVLIVAIVPEGLPTIVAVSLALNMIKLSKENALIKKMTATETAGAVSVICSDKTGTLTQNKMSVEEMVLQSDATSEIIKQNLVLNGTAIENHQGNERIISGSATEKALVEYLIKKDKNLKINDFKKRNKIIYSKPFSSKHKYMVTVIKTEEGYRALLKGAPEVVLEKSLLTNEQKEKIIRQMKLRQSQAKRVIAFAHADLDEFDETKEIKYLFDGFASLIDPLRPEVIKAVSDCKKAKIKIKILTGDNLITAKAIAQKLKIITSDSEVISAESLENLSDEEFKKIITKVSVIARSTPIIKLRVVKALKSLGEVVAVTGDGINDAPAIKHADVGIAMGVSGSEIAKESADVVLLDDSFATVVKTVEFGRNVYLNLKRFILFQLTVNVSALIFITACTLLGFSSPFNTLQLLWINLIMDGPPALTLGLESGTKKLMEQKPVDRKESLLSPTMISKILIISLFVSIITIMQYLYNILNVKSSESKSVIFTLFILFHLFNAFNCRMTGANSLFTSKQKNKLMVVVFFLAFILHFVIVQFAYKLFAISPLSFITWIKCIVVASTVIVVSELIKLVVRIIKSAI